MREEPKLQRLSLVQDSDVIVVGSGLAGLACSRALARAGKRVTVVERAKRVGGHLLPFERRGLRFEVGVHYLADTGEGSHFQQALSELGVLMPMHKLDACFDEVRLRCGMRVMVQAPFESFLSELRRLFPDDEFAIARYAEAVELVWSRVNQLRLPLSLPRILRAIIAHPELLQLAPYASCTYGKLLREDWQASPRLAEVLSFHHLIIGVPASALSALIYLTVHAYYFHGACFPEGGGQAMADKLQHSDVNYLTSFDALRVAKEGERFVVADAKRELSATQVVWTPDPRLLLKQRDIRLGRWLRHQLSEVRYPHAYVVGYFATVKELHGYGLADRNYCLMGSLSSEDAYLERDPVRLAEQAPLFLSTGSLRDKQCVQEGNEARAAGVFQAMFFCPPEARIWGGGESSEYHRRKARGGFFEDYKDIKKSVLSALVARLHREFPELKGDLLFQELGTPLSHRRFLGSPGLGGLGYQSTVRDALIGRPAFKTGEKGFYLCGQFIRPSHGLATALENGVGVAREILKES